MGNAVIVLDPHDDLIRNCIGKLPEERLFNTYILDMQDEEYPFGLNVFSGLNLTNSIALGQAIERVMHIFEVLWPDVMSQQHLPRYLRAAIIALFANPGSTLVDMYAFLTNDAFRRRMLQAVTDQSVRQFWQLQYDDLSPAQRYQRLESLVGRLESLFMGRDLVRNIVGQRETSINFREAIENKKIIFIRLPLKTLTQDARLIGILLIAQIYAAIFSFADLPENQRPGFSLFVDEFQHFATPDFAEMFTEGRKFGVRVTVAHQYRRQLPDYLRHATMTAWTKVCFRGTPEDNREMAHLFLTNQAIVRPEDIEPRPVEYLLRYDSDDPKVQTFVDWYIRPLQHYKSEGKVEIIRPGFRWDHIPFWLMCVQPPKGKPHVFDPTHDLNHLLYQVMKTGNANLRVPSQIILGCSNGGKGFYTAYRRTLNRGKLFRPDISYPAALVVEGADGDKRWTRAPEYDKEQLYHFLFHLRATMSYLAVNPIGKKSTLSPSDVAYKLGELPKRRALVRSGQDVGEIVTDDRMPGVSSEELQYRLAFARNMTRHDYCSQVKGADSPPLGSNTLSDRSATPRWEEVE